ncbi:lytic transglycosylase domain-containing protein [Pseudoxanthomonas putridarboris]|uniref:lytic transglycosylase domain-containing protein n=1 Tax=Pseudoxanthomonas putridarboris TaxID=752605 RepID=UPI00311EB133
MLLTAAVAAPAHGCGLAQWAPHIAEASQRYAVPEPWVRAVMRAESAGCTHLNGRPIVSHAGAMGLMQIMPATWAELRRRHGFGDDPHDPRENILAGAAYLREMADRFGVPGAFAAYHAGPGRYTAHVLHAAPLPMETRRYLVQVSAAAGLDGASHAADSPDAAGDSLFAITHPNRTAHGETPASPHSRLFVPLRHARPRGEASHVQP